jgi:cytochrome c556
MSKLRPSLLVPFVIGCLATGTALAQGKPPTKAEQALKYRKAVYQVMAWNFGPLAAMAQGKIPYDADQFQLRAERVATVAPLLHEAYPPETKDVANSKLKSEMWDNRADFDSKLKDLETRSAALAATSKSRDFDKSKAAFFDTANACKSCHDKYRAE